MSGVVTNGRRKRVTKTRNVQQLRQTKLILRVTAKRLAYNSKLDILSKNLGEQTLLRNEKLTESACNGFIARMDPSDIVVGKDDHSTPTQGLKSSSADEVFSRPKRNVFQKRTEACGLSWKEETELKKALYASLQRKKVKSESNNVSVEGNAESYTRDQNSTSNDTYCSANLKQAEVLKVSLLDKKKAFDSAAILFNRSRNWCNLFRAQRKFACGSKPSGRSLVSRRKFTKKIDCISKDSQNVPFTEDFIDYLCLRGTPSLPENLKFFDKFLCRDVDNFLEVPSSCKFADVPIHAAVVRKACDIPRRCQRTPLRKSSVLKNNGFTNAESSPKGTCRSLHLETEKHRPLTRSLAKKVPETFDSYQGFNLDSLDKNDDSNVGDDGDDDNDEDEGDDDDDDRSEGLSEVLSCFVKDDRHPMFYRKESIIDQCHNDNVGESGWIYEEENFPIDRFDDPMSNCSNDQLDPADGCCVEQSIDVGFACVGYRGITPFDETDDDVDDDNDGADVDADEDSNSYARKSESIHVNFINKKMDENECPLNQLSCDINNNDNGTSLGAVNKCVGTDNVDFLSNNAFESTFGKFQMEGSFSHHEQFKFNHENKVTSLDGFGRCMLSMTHNLPVADPPFKCIIPTADKTVHDGPMFLTNVPVVSMTSLSSVFVVPPIQNVGMNIIQFTSPSLFAPWQGSTQETSPVILTPAKLFGSSPSVEISCKETFIDGSHGLRKIAPKMTTELTTTSSSLEFNLSCQSCPPMTHCGGPNVQLIDLAQTCASDSCLTQNKLCKTKSFFVGQSRKKNWKRVAAKDLSKDLGHVEVQKSIGSSQPQISGFLSLRSGKVINSEESIKDEIKCDEKSTKDLCLAPVIKAEGKDIDAPIDKFHLKRNYFNGQHTAEKKQQRKRRRRVGIELIDRSWNRSGLKKSMEPCRDAKSIRPVTRSRRLASLENELTKAKMELEDEYNDGDFGD